MRAVVWLNGLYFYVELPGFVFIFRITGWIEGILFGMWANKVKETTTRDHQQYSFVWAWPWRQQKSTNADGCEDKTNRNKSWMSFKPDRALINYWMYTESRQMKRISFSFASGLMQKPSASTWGTFCKNK